MGTFSTSSVLNGAPCMITSISKAICEHFNNEGYTINEKDNCFGGKEISITKGGFFKSIIGMKTALNISLRPGGKDRIDFEAGIGIFGLHAIPTIITTFCFWPLIFTQIWGLVKQSKLDDTALEIARETIEKHWSANMGGIHIAHIAAWTPISTQISAPTAVTQ